MTLAEHDALLKEEGRYDAMVEEQERRERERQERAREWRKARVPLVADLRAFGVEVESEWDLVNTTKPYPDAVPVLLRHLPKGYPDRVREGIARALAARGPRALAAGRDRHAWDVLVVEFQKSKDPTALGAKWGMACALSVAGDDSVIEEVIELLSEERHGENRVPLLDVLARSQVEEAHRLLKNPADDPQLGQGAKELLKKKKRRRGRKN